MNTIVVDSFAEIVAKALERMAFVFTEPSEDGPGEVRTRPTMSAHVAIEGEGVQTQMCLSATQDFVVEVASAMLGLDEDEVSLEDYGSSTVTELANVLGGELLMAMGGGDEPLRLSLPYAATEDEVEEMVAFAQSNDTGGIIVLETDSGGCLMMAWGQR